MLKILMVGAVALLVVACGGVAADADPVDPPDCASAYCDLVEYDTRLPLPDPPVRISCAIFPPRCRAMYDQLCATRPYRQLCGLPY